MLNINSKLKIIIIYICLEECRSPLGMEFSTIPDHKITASSSYEVKSVGPQNARYVTQMLKLPNIKLTIIE